MNTELMIKIIYILKRERNKTQVQKQIMADHFSAPLLFSNKPVCISAPWPFTAL